MFTAVLFAALSLLCLILSGSARQMSYRHTNASRALFVQNLQAAASEFVQSAAAWRGLSNIAFALALVFAGLAGGSLWGALHP